MLLFIDNSSVSHCDTSSFKYISCCCLSPFQALYHTLYSLFKYISCCCLSATSSIEATLNSYSNTSHVVVYRRWICHIIHDSHIQIHLMLLFIYLLFQHFYQPYLNSNTSHVVVYRSVGDV